MESIVYLDCKPLLTIDILYQKSTEKSKTNQNDKYSLDQCMLRIFLLQEETFGVHWHHSNKTVYIMHSIKEHHVT